MKQEFVREMKVRFVRPPFLRKMEIKDFTIDMGTTNLVESVKEKTSPFRAFLSSAVLVNISGILPVSQRARKSKYKKTWKFFKIAIEQTVKRPNGKKEIQSCTLKGRSIIASIQLARTKRGKLFGKITVRNYTKRGKNAVENQDK